MSRDITTVQCMADALQGVDIKTKMVKLARAVQTKLESCEPDDRSAAWLSEMEVAMSWALSDDAGDLQLIEIDNAPPAWVDQFNEINSAFLLGMDFTKVQSYSNMVKTNKFLKRKEKEAADADDADKPAVLSADADETPADAAETDEDAAEDKDADKAEDTDAEEAEPDGETDAEPDGDAGGEADEAETDPDEEVLMPKNDALIAAAVITALLESGQEIDPDNIVLCPGLLTTPVKQMLQLTDLKQSALAKGFTNLVKKQYEIHLAELAEGERRKKKGQQTRADKAAKKAAIDEANAKKAAQGKKKEPEKLVLPTKASLKDPTKAAQRPPTRGAVDKDKSGGFASLIQKG